MTAPHPYPAPDAPADVRSEIGGPVHPAFVPRAGGRRAGSVVAAVVGISIAAVALLAALTFFLVALGPVLVAISGILAFVPLAIVLAGLRWVDRWEPEPFGALLFAFLWGAGVAVVVALLVDAEVERLAGISGSSSDGPSIISLVVQAPLVEESAKGFGILVLFWFGRRFFDSPVDGIVYAIAIAGGFAFTENIEYFGVGIAQAQSVSDIASLFVLRGLMSPFAHATFTSMTGLFIGLGSRRTSAGGAIGWYLLGLIPAALLHALWNGGAALFGGDFFGYYLLVQVPIFAILLTGIVLLRIEERRTTQLRLQEYANAGWIAPDEVPALATPHGRRIALQWARERGIAPVMRAYIRDATHLAFARQRIVDGRRRAQAQADEATLLGRISAGRRALRGLPA